MSEAELQLAATLAQSLIPLIWQAIQLARAGQDPLDAFDTQTIASTVPSPLLAELALKAAAVADAARP